jgi:hypothetical protein
VQRIFADAPWPIIQAEDYHDCELNAVWWSAVVVLGVRFISG